jgi:hypothetical protein
MMGQVEVNPTLLGVGTEILVSINTSFYWKTAGKRHTRKNTRGVINKIETCG